jgi:outer membrane murein-binding lipoprotein Lpp
MRRLPSFLILATMALVLSGCPQKQGTFEKAGAKLDKATDNAEDAINKTVNQVGEKVEKAADQAHDAAEKAAKEIEKND